MAGRKHSSSLDSFDRKAGRLCDEMIEIAQSAGDIEGVRLGRLVKRSLETHDQQEISRRLHLFEEHALNATLSTNNDDMSGA